MTYLLNLAYGVYEGDLNDFVFDLVCELAVKCSLLNISISGIEKWVFSLCPAKLLRSNLKWIQQAFLNMGLCGGWKFKAVHKRDFEITN